MPQPNWRNDDEATAWAVEQLRDGRPVEEVTAEVIRQLSHARPEDSVQWRGMGHAIVEAAAAQLTQEGRDTDGDGQVSPAEQNSGAQQDAASDQAGAILEQDPNNPEAQAVLDSAATDSRIIEYFGGEAPTPEDTQEAVDAYNALNPSNPVATFTDLANRWSTGTDAAAQQAIDAIAPEWKEDTVSIRLRAGGKDAYVQVPAARYQAMQKAYGTGFTRNQQLIYGTSHRSNRNLPASAVAGALAVAGAMAVPEMPTQGDAGYAEAITIINAYEVYKQSADQSRFIRLKGKNEREQAQSIMDALGDDEAFQEALASTRGNAEFQGAIQRTERQRGPTGKGKDPTKRAAAQAATAARDYQGYYEQYGNHGLALVAIRNPKLADVIYETGRVPAEHANMVEQIFMDAGYSREQWMAQGDSYDGDQFDAILAGSLNGQGGGGGGQQVRIVNLPDDAALEESMRNLWRAWFRREPSADELGNFVGSIDGMFRSEEQRLSAATQQGGGRNIFKDDPNAPAATIDQRNIDPGAELVRRARASELYREMFGKKPDYMSEEDYAGKFESTAQSFAGNTITQQDAVAGGMRSGDTNTTVGQLFLDPTVFNNSSTFRDRLFTAAQTIRDVL